MKEMSAAGTAARRKCEKLFFGFRPTRHDHPHEQRWIRTAHPLQKVRTMNSNPHPAYVIWFRAPTMRIGALVLFATIAFAQNAPKVAPDAATLARYDKNH